MTCHLLVLVHEYFMFLPVPKLYGDANLLFQQKFASAHSAKTTTDLLTKILLLLIS